MSEYLSPGCSAALPWLGVYRGRKAVREFLDHMHKNLDITAYGERQVISEGNRVAAFGWFRLHSLTTGRSSEIAYAIYLEMRDGLIARYHFVENTLDVANTFRVGGAWVVNTDEVPHEVPSVNR